MVYLPRHVPGVASVSHYYGDVVRWLFMTAAVAILLTHPFYANHLRSELPFTLVGALILVALAALTNPHNKNIVTADAVAAGAGMLIYQAWALFEYESSTWVEFSLRQAIAILFMVAFYFGLKTLRSMLLHKIGKHEEVGEFDDDTPMAEDIPPPPLQRMSSSPSEPVNLYLRPERKNDDAGSAENAEYEEKRRARVASESAKRDQELNDITAGRE